MNKRSIRLIMSAIFIFLVFVCQGMYLFYRKGISLNETFDKLRIEIGNIFIVSLFGLVVVIVFSLTYTRFFRNKK